MINTHIPTLRIIEIPKKILSEKVVNSYIFDTCPYPYGCFLARYLKSRVVTNYNLPMKGTILFLVI